VKKLIRAAVFGRLKTFYIFLFFAKKSFNDKKLVLAKTEVKTKEKNFI